MAGSRPAAKAVLRHVFIVTVALLVNALLFVSIPFMQELLGFGFHFQKTTPPVKTIIAEYIRPQTEEIKSPITIARTMTVSAPGREGTATGEGSDPAMRFSPDLGVEGGGGVATVKLGGQDLAAVVFEEGKTDEGVIPVSQEAIPYPEEARELKIEGTLELRMVIDRTGRVGSLEIVKSPHPSISAAARRIVPTWKFKPAKNKGIPVNLRVSQAIEFKLD